jgi:hypothetical protein
MARDGYSRFIWVGKWVMTAWVSLNDVVQEHFRKRSWPRNCCQLYVKGVISERTRCEQPLHYRPFSASADHIPRGLPVPFLPLPRQNPHRKNSILYLHAVTYPQMFSAHDFPLLLPGDRRQSKKQILLLPKQSWILMSLTFRTKRRSALTYALP